MLRTWVQRGSSSMSATRWMKRSCMGAKDQKGGP